MGAEDGEDGSFTARGVCYGRSTRDGERKTANTGLSLTAKNSKSSGGDQPRRFTPAGEGRYLICPPALQPMLPLPLDVQAKDRGGNDGISRSEGVYRAHKIHGAAKLPPKTTTQNPTGGRKARRDFWRMFSSAISANSCKS